jgi:hypothetical protein
MSLTLNYTRKYILIFVCVCVGGGGELTSCLLPRNEKETLKNYGSIVEFTTFTSLCPKATVATAKYNYSKRVFRSDSNSYNISKLQG